MNSRKNSFSEVYEVMKKYGKMMSSQEYPIGRTKMMIETPKGVFATRDDADIGELREEDIEKLGIEKLPIPKAEMKAVVYSQTPCCQKALREARPFKACLDGSGFWSYCIYSRRKGWQRFNGEIHRKSPQRQRRLSDTARYR